MPVLITGATGLVGRALAARLVDEGGEVRAYVRRDDPALRGLGVHLAVGAIDDVPRLESALTRVHTIVHLVGGSWPERGVSYDDLNRETTECAVIAATAAEVRRFVFLSFRGADPGSANELLAAKGAAEEHVLASGLEHAILRSPPIAEWLAVRDLGAANAIALADVVEALVAADARDAEVRGVWALPGSETIPGGPALRLLGRPPRALADALARSAEEAVPAWP